MNVLVLGPKNASIVTIIKKCGQNLLESNDIIDLALLKTNKIECIVSYRYRHIIRKDVIDYMRGNIINLHISFLPWNRGADPNLWSFLENTPKGVSIHYIDEGIDTGNIIIQKEYLFKDDTETLTTTYNKLNYAMIQLFQNNWHQIYSGNITAQRQKEKGSFHKMEDKRRYLHLLKQGWNTPVKDIVGKAL
jgi:methionyl-tRNA formyltransferase